MKVWIVFSYFIALCRCICPLCPIIAGATMSGGLSVQNSILSWMTGLTSVPFMLAFFDGFRTRNMTFATPEKHSIVKVNESLDLYMETFGLSSRSYFRTSDLYILNASFDRVAKIASESEFKVILHSDYSKFYVLPRAGFGHLKWTVPSLPNGRYYLKYISGWSIWRHEGKFSAISSQFYILDSDCDENCLKSIPQSQDPSDFTQEDAPMELQFMFPKYHGVKAASLDLIAGVASTPRLMRHPKKALNEWENEFEKNPFKATGEAVGLAGALTIAFKGSSRLRGKSPCYGGACGPMSNFDVEISVFFGLI